MKVAVSVPVLESERGWGSKIDDHMICLTKEDANNFVKEFNAVNNLESTPDWYMAALTDFEVIDLTDNQYKFLEENQRYWLSGLKKID